MPSKCLPFLLTRCLVGRNWQCPRYTTFLLLSKYILLVSSKQCVHALYPFPSLFPARFWARSLPPETEDKGEVAVDPQHPSLSSLLSYTAPKLALTPVPFSWPDRPRADAVAGPCCGGFRRGHHRPRRDISCMHATSRRTPSWSLPLPIYRRLAADEPPVSPTCQNPSRPTSSPACMSTRGGRRCRGRWIQIQRRRTLSSMRSREGRQIWAGPAWIHPDPFKPRPDTFF
jgi:hypothetical protein